MGGGVFDVEKQFALYGAYHSNPMNIFIHTIFVWPIFFTSLILFYFTPPLLRLDIFFGGLDINLAFIYVLLFALFYIALDGKAGSLAALLSFLCWFGSQSLAAAMGFSLAWKVVLGALALCWTGLFIGHRVFEKRSPALLDNLSIALLMAPFFVLLEVLGSSFGYEPYPGFEASVRAKISLDRKAWQANKLKKSS